MRIVVDTNVFIGACLMGQAIPCMGTTLLAECEAVMQRPGLLQASGLKPDEREELLNIVLARCQWIRIYSSWRPNLPDEADNHLVELAVAAGAQAIVSRNTRDLNRPELRFPDIALLRPEQFLADLP
jgi:predicted nucleic acid-binding protein